MKLPDVSGVYDYAGPTRDSRYRPRRFAFHQVKSVGVLIASFRSSIPSPPVPLFTLRRTPHDVQRKTRGRMVRYSFLVGLLHSLLHAGLARRTDSVIYLQLRSWDAMQGVHQVKNGVLDLAPNVLNRFAIAELAPTLPSTGTGTG